MDPGEDRPMRAPDGTVPRGSRAANYDPVGFGEVDVAAVRGSTAIGAGAQSIAQAPALPRSMPELGSHPADRNARDPTLGVDGAGNAVGLFRSARRIALGIE